MQIEHLNDEFIVDAMMMGTRMGKLHDKIMIKKPQTFSKVMQTSIKFLNLDEDREIQKKDKEKIPKRK